MLTPLLDDLLTPEQQVMLARHLSQRMSAGFGTVVIQVAGGSVSRIGQEFLEDADPSRLIESMPGVHPLPARRRRK